MPEGLREDPYHWTELPSLNKDYYYYIIIINIIIIFIIIIIIITIIIIINNYSLHWLHLIVTLHLKHVV